MKRIYHHYSVWEDWKAGLYRLPSTRINESKLIVDSIDLLSDGIRFYEVGFSVINEWTKSAEVNLSCRNRNRQAWIGQASCCYACGSPEYITKIAWHNLSIIQQTSANAIADEIILAWENQYAKT